MTSLAEIKPNTSLATVPGWFVDIPTMSDVSNGYCFEVKKSHYKRRDKRIVFYDSSPDNIMSKRKKSGGIERQHGDNDGDGKLLLACRRGAAFPGRLSPYGKKP